MRGRSLFHRKNATSPLLATILAVAVFGVPLLAPRAVQAIPVEDTVNLGPNTVTAVQTSAIAGSSGVLVADATKKTAGELLRISLTNTAAVAVLNGINYFAQKVAYDTAVYISAGGKGQKPLIFDSPGAYFKQVGQDAAGEVLGTLTTDPKTFGKYGFNICAPSDPRIALNIKLGLLGSLPRFGLTSAPTPKCTWDSISNNWDSFYQRASTGEVLDNIGVMFSPGQSSLSAAIEVNNVVLKEIAKKKEAATVEQVQGQGFKSVQEKVSGQVKTPAATVKKSLDYSVEGGFKVTDNTTQITAGSFGAGALGVLTASLKTFAGTLTNNLSKRIFEAGLISINDLFSDGDSALTFDAAPPLGGRATAELANASLLTPNILSVSSYNELLEFASCPESGKTPNNCVIDQQFFGALSRAEQGVTVTLRQAIQQGYVNRNWQLIPLAHQKNLQGNCYDEAFCYSNLVKLRRARIIPAGWELAANSPFNDVSRPVTLGEVMDRFDDCPVTTDASGAEVVDTARLPDPAHPWCHLIDPEWVLKYPAASCRARGPGPTLVSPDSTARASVCADVATCVAEDASGNCVGGYGYCVREKAVWRMDADACPAQFASCTTYQRAGGGQFSFLSNTLDGAGCNSENAGCRRYSLSPNAVPNGGFEDLIGGEARDWQIFSSTRLHKGGRLSVRGSNALGVDSGGSAVAKIEGLIPGSSYRLSSAVIQELENTTATATVRVTFQDAQGATIAPPTSLDTTCRNISSGTAIELDILSSSLGHLSGSCEVTLPQGATEAEITLLSSAPVGNRTWFDEVGFFGASSSASPYDAVFMNAKAEACPDGQAGCTEFVRLASGTLNLVRNPSFEEADALDLPTFWSGVDEDSYDFNAQTGFDGLSAYALSPAAVSQRVDGLVADAAHSFSIRTRLDGVGSNTARASIQLFDSNEPPSPVSPASVDGCTLTGSRMDLALATGADYEVSECRFTTSSDVSHAVITLSSPDDAPRVLADAVQLELSVRATAFHEGHASGAERVHLKQAPAGLDCTGANPPAECGEYAPACRRDEVGCNSYTPADGGASIPAVATDGGLCPGECAGYDTFRQEESVFSDPAFPMFLIPSTARSCTAAEVGCSEFTNIERLAAGGEAREYYSYLRLCAPPGPDSRTFYTWEGDEGADGGLRLRTWSLLRSNIAAAPVSDADPSGGNAPCTKLGYDVSGRAVCVDDAASVAEASCSRAQVAFNADCREFYDDAGNIHYRFYSKTVVSTDDCKEYRITKTTESECATHGGLWRNGECRYRSYAAESVSCRAEAAGCRAYSGNASRNVRTVSSDTFETLTTDGWASAPGGAASGDVINSNESVSAAGHSLRVQRDDIYRRADSVRAGKQYLLTFWAKGSGDLTARFTSAASRPFTYDPIDDRDEPVALTTEWRPYQIGPVTAEAAAASDEHLVIERIGGGGNPLYLDNIELREVSENIFLVEGSWETPDSCDQSPTGAPSPQYMLGCRAYDDVRGVRSHFKSFEKLCRPEAVGCEALYDTRNSGSAFAQTYNAVCTLSSACTGLSCPCQVAGTTVCEAVRGSDSCRYDADDAVPAANVSTTGDTARVPADGLVYLVNDPRFRCESANMGCTELGDRVLTPDRDATQGWSKKVLKNLPDTYATTLCKTSEEFCQAYTRRADGAQVYFRDPDTRVCEFRESTVLTSGGVTANGWFRKGSNEPCDEAFLEAGTRFGIWKNSDAGYDGWAGSCDARYDMCKEFIDPEDRSSGDPAGKPYYAIMNSRLDTKSCLGRASLRQSPSGANDASACVLFWQTDDLKKTFDAAATYAKSEEANGALVSTVDSGPDDNTANIVIRVKRDRQCGEWLDCRSSENVFNPSTGQYQSVCTAFSLCAEFERVGNSTRCVRYVDSSYAGKVLSAGVYAGRDVSWEGMEYSGFGIPNRYPVEELVTVNVANSASNPDLRLVRATGTCAGAYGSTCGPVGDQGSCLGPAGQRQCVYPIDGGRLVTDPSHLALPQIASGYPGAACRVYPQENAPFPSTVADPNGWNLAATDLNNGNPTHIGNAPAFAAANVCQRRLVNGVEVSTCECSYFIAKYGSSTKYFPAESEDIPQGYCVGGAFENYECDPLARGARSKNNLSCCSQTPGDGDLLATGCSDGAQCTRLNKVDRVVGYEGQCLERDFTSPINGRNDQYACVTWRPVGLIGGSRDIYNQHQTAGYFAPTDRRFYCAGAQQSWALMFDIPSRHPNPANDTERDENFAVSTDSDPALDYRDLDIMNYFGIGTIHNAASSGRSQGKDCEDEEGGKWCVWPSTSSASYRYQQVACPSDANKLCVKTCTANSDCDSGHSCQDFKSAAEPGKCVANQADWFIDQDAKGILGCYEVADGGNVDTTFIDYPYIGPPMYRDQLSSIYFQITDDIYDRITPLQRGEIRTTDVDYLDIPTNPHQNVIGDCNDEDDDNIDNEDGDSSDSNPIGEDLVTSGEGGRSLSVFHLNEQNGFRADPSDGEGTIVLSAAFDKNGRLASVRVAAGDGSDEGAFGIIRMGIVFKPGCQQIVQVDETGGFGATVAFTDSVNPYRDFTDADVSDVYGEGHGFGDACRPYGALGAVAAAPTIGSTNVTRSPWTYVAHRRTTDLEQCTDLSFMKGVTYDLAAPVVADSSTWVDSLRRLFRRVFGIWSYDRLRTDGTRGGYLPASGLYDETGVVDIEDMIIRGRSVVTWYPPRIASVAAGACEASGACKPGNVGAMSINGAEGGLVLGADGAMAVSARFFAWASHDSMPIASRTILWGDFSTKEPPATGWYKNQKPVCSPDISDENAVGECSGARGLTCSVDTDCPTGSTCQDVGNHFGNTPGACSAAPYQFDHTYTCSLKDLEAMPTCTGSLTAAANAPCVRLVSGTPVCVYRPKVQIVDNWGWCNCTGAGCRESGGAYGAGCALEGAPANAVPWTEFGGEIRLAPTLQVADEYLN